MNEESVKQILLHVLDKTEWRWRQYAQHWKDIDRIFVEKGFEQQGFECHKFVRLLDERGIYSIGCLGAIMASVGSSPEYRSEYAGSITAPFYEQLRRGEGGDAGRLYRECVQQFLSDQIGRPGRFYWMLLWRMLSSCEILQMSYGGSYALYLKRKYCRSANLTDITDEDLLGLSPEEWARFKTYAQPWTELPGIGENVFDYIVGDIVEASFANNSYKLDSANEHFFRVTGIYRLVPSIERTEVISFLVRLGLKYTLREINKGIYTYCSVTEAHNFGFCRSADKCLQCGVRTFCEKNLRINIIDKQRATITRSVINVAPPVNVRQTSVNKQNRVIEELCQILRTARIPHTVSPPKQCRTGTYIGIKHGNKLVFTHYFRNSFMEVFPPRQTGPAEIARKYGISGQGDPRDYTDYVSKYTYALSIQLNMSAPEGKVLGGKWKLQDKAKFFVEMAKAKIGK